MAVEKKWPVVDTHLHVGVSTSCTFVAEEELAGWMSKGGIDIQVIFQVNQAACHETPEWNPYLGNDYLAKVQDAHPGRVLALATINPWLQPPPVYTYPKEKRGIPFPALTRNLALEECERAIEDLGLHGVKWHPREHGFPINCWAVRQVCNKLLDIQRRIARRLFIVVHAATDSNYNTPEALADLAKDYPDLLILMAHAGSMWGGKTLASVVGPCENVLFDLTACSDAGTVAGTLERYGVGRFVAGSDGPFASPIVKEAIVKSIFPDPEDQALVLGGNFCKLLGLVPAAGSPAETPSQ